MKFSLKKQALLIYELSNKNHLKNINEKNSRILWGGYEGVMTKAFTVHGKKFLFKKNSLNFNNRENNWSPSKRTI